MGLIAAELISNAIERALPDDRAGTIRIDMDSRRLSLERTNPTSHSDTVTNGMVNVLGTVSIGFRKGLAVALGAMP